MQHERAMLWSGYFMSAAFALFMLGASVAPKLLDAEAATGPLVALGWPGESAALIGLIELACVVLYLIPRTNVLGAILTMGLLGGAVAAHLRTGSPLFSHTLFGVYMGIVMWGGLWLRDPRVRELFPFRRTKPAGDSR